MANAKKCDICGKYYDKQNVTVRSLDHILGNIKEQDICYECHGLIKAFIESITEGTLAVGLLEYFLSIYSEDEFLSMLKQRGDKNGETEN